MHRLIWIVPTSPYMNVTCKKVFVCWESFQWCRIDCSSDCRTAEGQHEVIITPPWCQWSGPGDIESSDSSPVTGLSLSLTVCWCNPCLGCCLFTNRYVHPHSTLYNEQLKVQIFVTMFPMLGTAQWDRDSDDDETSPRSFVEMILLTSQLSDLASDCWRWVCLMSQPVFILLRTFLSVLLRIRPGGNPSPSALPQSSRMRALTYLHVQH